MVRDTTETTEAVRRYIIDHGRPPDDLVLDLVERTRRAVPDHAGMQIALEQGQLLDFLVRLTGARRILEIGTFTGMSSLWMARAAGPEAHILCLDISEEFTAIARDVWDRAGVADRIELRVGPAIESLRAVDGPFDLAFVDADKEGYPAYLAELVPRIRPGGLLVADNVLWSGRVVDDADSAASTAALREFNRSVADHPELESVILPVSDGMTVARRRRDV